MGSKKSQEERSKQGVELLELVFEGGRKTNRDIGFELIMGYKEQPYMRKASIYDSVVMPNTSLPIQRRGVAKLNIHLVSD